MAGNNRDVNLTIRARDEAKKTLESVAKAVAELTGQQQNLIKSASKADAVLSKLGTGFTTLSASLQNLEQFAAVAKTLEQASGAMDRFEDSISRSKKNTADAVEAFGKMSSEVRRLKDEKDKATAAFQNSADAIKNEIRATADSLKLLKGQKGDAAKSFVIFEKANLKEQQNALASLETNVRESGAAAEAAQRQMAKLRQEAIQNTTALKDQKNEYGLFRTQLLGTVNSINTYANNLANATQKTTAFGNAFNAAAAQQKSIISPLANFASSAGKAQNSFSGLAQGLNQFNSSGQRTLTVAEAIRREIIGLTVSYIGLYSAMDQVGQVVKAFQTVEAVQSRLGVVFDGDFGKVGAEVARLRDESIRLGISFEVLGDTYSKFAVAADAANFTTEQTRYIFTSVAEAARVNKTSIENLRGVFLALEQMISKGKISSEELRRQLGDRMAGAFNIFAAGLGLSTEKLDELLRKGEIFSTSTTMLDFADEINRRFGKQLPSALESLTTQLGRFDALLFDMRVRVAKNGFAEELRLSIDRVNDALQGDAGSQFARVFGEMLAALSKGLVFIINNFGLLTDVAKLFISLKIAQAIGGIGASAFQAGLEFRKLYVEAVKAGQGFVGFSSGAIATNMAKLRTSVVGLGAALSQSSGLSLRARASFLLTSAATIPMRAAFTVTAGAARAMWIAIGGFPGAIITAATFAISALAGSWVNGVEKSAEALESHERILTKIRDGYQDVGKAVKAGAGGITENEAVNSLKKLKKGLDEIRQESESTRELDSGFFHPFDNKYQKELRALRQEFLDGKISAQKFKEELNRFAQANPGKLSNLVGNFEGIANKALDAEKSVSEAEAALRIIRGEATDADRALLGLADAASELGQELNMGKALEAYAEGLKGIKEFIPELAGEMRRLKEQAELKDFVAQIESLGPASAEVMAQIQRARQAINVNAFANNPGISSLERSVTLLQKFEGYSARPYMDSDNRLRAGYGSDTVTLADGSIKKVVEGITVTQDDALRDLVRRIGEFQDRVKSQVGSDRFSAFTNEQQAALTSIAYNYGSLPQRIVEAVKTGSADQIAAAVRGLAGDNGGINAGRRNQEAAILAQGGSKLDASNADLLKERQDDEKKFLESLKEQNDQRLFEIQNLQKAERQQAINTAVYEAQVSAQKEGVKLSRAQVQQIEETTGRLFDVQNREKLLTEQRKAAEKGVNDLVERRALLQEQLKYYTQTGDNVQMGRLEEQIGGINTEILAAIENSKKMLQALGGPEADALILKLETIGLGIKDLGDKSVITGKQVDDLIVSAGSGAFDDFSRSIAEGKNAVDSFKEAFLNAAAEFLRAISQMIIQQLILNALGGGSAEGKGSATGNGIAGFVNGLFRHSGGLVQSSANGRAVPAAWFANAERFHGGGLPGLRSNEIPTILQKGEEVLTANDPRHILNGGGASGSTEVKIVNTIDSGDFISNGLDSPVGQSAIMNFIRSNKGAVKAAIGG